MGFDPESVPDIVPFNLPRIEDFRSAHSSKVLKSKASEASAASIAASTAAAVLAMKAGGGKPKSTSLLERIREKEKAKKEEDAFKNPNEKRIGQMAQLIKEVLMLVWSKKPKNGKGCSSVAYPQLCADLRRKSPTTSPLESETLILLLVEETKLVCAGTCCQLCPPPLPPEKKVGCYRGRRWGVTRGRRRSTPICIHFCADSCALYIDDVTAPYSFRYRASSRALVPDRRSVNRGRG